MLRYYRFLQLFNNGETRCAICGAWCQGFKAPDGKIICSDCYKKYW